MSNCSFFSQVLAKQRYSSDNPESDLANCTLPYSSEILYSFSKKDSNIWQNLGQMISQVLHCLQRII